MWQQVIVVRIRGGIPRLMSLEKSVQYVCFWTYTYTVPHDTKYLSRLVTDISRGINPNNIYSASCSSQHEGFSNKDVNYVNQKKM